MRRHSPSNDSPPRRGYGGRGRSPPRRKHGGGRRETGQSLLVRNIPLNCRPEDLRISFERYGRVRDVYLPRDYYSGEPRGFAFVEFVDPGDAAEAQYNMNHQRFGGREITVVVASEARKRPDDMRQRARLSGPSHRDAHRSAYGRSRSRSPRYRPPSRTRQTSRSYTPPSRRQGDYSASPKRPSDRTRFPRDYPEGRAEDRKQRSQSPLYSGANHGRAEKEVYDDDDDDERRHSYSRSPRHVSRSRRHVSRSLSGSRSRSADSGRSG